MKKLIIVNKKEGETPLEALENLRVKEKISKDISMTYAGRLDPMASGLLIILTGKEVKNKQKYLDLNKTYRFSVLFGFATDTYDILGKVVKCDLAQKIDKKKLEEKIQKELKNFKGKLKQKYPTYSSKTVNGKPLFQYARDGEGIEIPEREIFIKKIKLEEIRKVGNKKLLENIESRIGKVNGDFRQKEILKIWQKNLKREGVFYIADFEVVCSSGTYVRGIANSLGEKMNIPALAFLIKRTKVGKYAIIS